MRFVPVAGGMLVVAGGVMGLAEAWRGRQAMCRPMHGHWWWCSAADRASILPSKMCSTVCVAPGQDKTAFVAARKLACVVSGDEEEASTSLRSCAACVAGVHGARRV